MELPIFGVSAAIALALSLSLSMSIALAELRESSAQEQTARLRVGDMVQIDGSDATLTFKAVTRDLRCPKGVRCIRAGEAVIVLELRAEVVRRPRSPSRSRRAAGVTVLARLPD